MGNKSTDEPREDDEIFKFTSNNPKSSVIVTSDQKNASVDKLVNSTESLTDSHFENNSVAEEKFIQKACSNYTDCQSSSLNRKYFENLEQSPEEGKTKEKLEDALQNSCSTFNEIENDEESVKAVLEFLDNIIDGEDFDVETSYLENDEIEQNITKKIETSMQLFSNLLIEETSEIVKGEKIPRDDEADDLDNKFTNNMSIENLWMEYDCSYANELDEIIITVSNRQKEEKLSSFLACETSCSESSLLSNDYNDGWLAISEPLTEVNNLEHSTQDVTSAISHLRHQLTEILPHSGGSHDYCNQESYDIENLIDEVVETKCEEERSNELLLSYKRSLSPIVEEPEVEDMQSSIHSTNKITLNGSTTTIESSVDALDVSLGQMPKTLYASNDTLFAFEDSFNDIDIVSPRILPPSNKTHDKFGDEISQSQMFPLKETSEKISEISYKSSNDDCEISYSDEHTESHNTQLMENTMGQDLTISINEIKTCISKDKEEERLSEISEPTFDSEIYDKAHLSIDEQCRFNYCKGTLLKSI